jgi:hypothetical protein
MGSVYKLPEREVDDSCHSWRVPSKKKGDTKGTQRGDKGDQQGEKEKSGELCHVHM